MFAIFDVAIDSAIPLPELPAATGAEERVIRIDVHRAPGALPDAPWTHHWRDRQGTVTASCARTDGHYLLMVPGVARFSIPPTLDRIEVEPREAVPPATLRHALLDQVIPMCLGQQGRQVLHASAVRLGDGRVLGFVGESGAGKSTLASALVAAGAEMLTDDCLLIEQGEPGLVALGNYPGVRLNGDSATHLFGVAGEPGSVAHHSAKSRVPLAPPDGPRRGVVSALFVLAEPGDDNGEIQLSPLASVESLLPLIKQHFYLDVADKALLRTRFAQIQRLLDAGLPLFNLHYPRRFELLGELIDAVTRAAQ